MGSSTSKVGRKRGFLSSFFCGASASRASVEVTDHLGDLSSMPNQNLALHHAASVSSVEHPSSTFGFETGFTSSPAESGATSGSSSGTAEYTSIQHSCSNHSKHLDVHGHDSLIEPLVADSSLKFGLPIEARSGEEPNAGIVHQETGNLHLGGRTTADLSTDGFTDDSGLDVSATQETSQQLPRFLLSVGEQGAVGMGVILVDVVSIHSNILSTSIAEINNRETRRNSRRMFWDVFSRNNFRRNRDSSTIVFTTSHADYLGSHDRWLLDFSGDLHYDGIGRESRYSSPRSRRLQQSRYEMSERFHDVYDEQDWQGSFCATGRHHRGMCSCESSSIAEESGSHMSISQILMLADSLVEVLEEIHRHRMSLPLTMLTLPAPEAVVDSFPLKDHKKACRTESGGTHDVQQCHICLVDYEEGDKIRVLPCSHEYHMSCVDKWLKEVHGICPLCRDDVCKGAAEGSAQTA